MATRQIADPVVERPRVALGLTTIFLAYFAYMYFYQILLSALPRIAADLDGMHLYSWGVSIPNLGLAFSMLVAGKLSDLYGRRAVLIVCISVCLVGAVWSAMTPSFVMLIIARTLLCIGQGGIAPLCFSAIGDMFDPVQRSRWVGLLNIPAGIFAFVGPTLGGWFADSLSWRYIFWCGIPLLIVTLLMVIFGLSGQRQSTKPKIDSNGAILAAIASSTLILTFSLAGTMYPWLSVQVLGLCVASIIAWIFFVKAEARAEEPILDLELMKNRSFVTIVCACILSSFGMVGLMIYYPLMMQGVQGATATLTGQVMTPGNVFMNFLGIPAGFLLARTRRYKGMFILGYGLTLAVMVFLIFFKGTTPISWGLVAISLAGIGMGAIPTLNTLVAQYAVPKRLLGVSMGALFFSVMLGQAIAPAILGSAMNMQYNSTLKTLLPAEVSGTASQATMTSIGNPKVLMSQSAMHTLRETLQKESPNGTAVAEQTVSAIRSSMEAGLRICYILGAIAMLLTFLTICTIPQISIDKPAE
jgi:MFS family permease